MGILSYEFLPEDKIQEVIIMSLSKKRKRAKDFHDKTPADYRKAKKLSISADLRDRHSGEAWEGGSDKSGKKAKKFGDKSPKDYDRRRKQSSSRDWHGFNKAEPWERRYRKDKAKKKHGIKIL